MRHPSGLALISIIFIFLCFTFGQTEKSPDAIPTRRIGIIGSGITGASTCHFLRSLYTDQTEGTSNIHITVFEKNAHIGGRLHRVDLTSKAGHYNMESGGSVIHTSNYYMKSFIHSLGLTKVLPADKKLSIWDHDQHAFVFKETGNAYIDFIQMLWRYGISLRHLSPKVKQLLKQFSSIYTLQDKEKRSFNTVKEMLDAMSDYDVYNGHDADARRYEDKPNHKDGKDNIYQHNNDNHIPKKENTNKQSQQSRKTPDIDFYTLTQHTIRDKLVELGIDSLFIDEFVTGAMRVNYGQAASTMNAMAGYVSLAGIQKDSLFAVKEGNYKVPELLISQCADAVHLNTQITSIEKVKQTPSPPQAQAQKPSSSMSPLPIFYKLTATSSVVDANDGSEADLDDMNLEFDAIVLATPIELTIHRQPQERSGGRRYNDGNGIDTSNSENINDSIIADVNMHETVRLDDSLTMTLKGSVFSEKTKRFWRERQHASLFQQTVATFVTGVINPAYFDTKGGSTASTSISSSLLLSLFSILSLLPLSPSDGQSDPADVPGVILTREPSSPSSLSSLNSVLFSSLGKYDKLTQTQAPGNDERKDGPDHEKTTPELSNSNENPDMRVWKIFSREELTEDELERLFTKVVNATVIPWRAYPHYVVSPQAETLTSFRIDEYDDETSATDNKSSNTKTVRRDDGSGFGVYYPNAIEWTASAMEMGAIGGYNSALLIHNQDRRLRDEMHRDTEEKEKEEICVA